MTAEQKKKKKKSLKSWIDGDMLTSPFLSRQIGLIALVAALVIVYVSNRYAFQHEQVEIQELRSKRIIDRLSLISAPKAHVIRDGAEQECAVGDIVKDL